MSNFIVGQIGIPRHSAVAKMLYNEHLLDQFIVDNYFSQDGILAKIPLIGPKLTSSLKKYDAGFPASLVSADWYGAVHFRQLLKKERRVEAFKFANKRLGERLIDYAKNKPAGKYFGFDTVSSHFLEWSHRNGWKGYLEQCVAPRRSQIEMWELFQEKYNSDYSAQIEYCRFQQDIEHKEWAYADYIIVPSQYVKEELIKDSAIDINKVHIVNYGYTPTRSREDIIEKINNRFSDNKNKTINVLFAGNAGYRKGIADILSIASMLGNENVCFIIAGQLEEDATKLINQHGHNNVKYVGKLSKEKLEEQYANADIFFFPSYLEGSALVLIEAMSWGLPIVTTNQSGSVVADGINGFIAKSGDVETLKNYMIKLTSDAELRFNMSTNALNASFNYSVENYGKNLLKVLSL